MDIGKFLYNLGVRDISDPDMPVIISDLEIIKNFPMSLRGFRN